MSDYEHIIIEKPAPEVRRIVLNRPEKRNAISTPMRTEIFHALQSHDTDEEVRVTIIRGAGDCFSSGYDLTSGGLMEDAPIYSAPGDGQWTRQATDSWFSIWDLAKPVIAQIHGYAMAGGTELASACDLVYMADNATIGYPVVRVMSTPDWQFHTPLLGLRASMEMMLTGNTYSAEEAVQVGFANRAYPADRLDDEVLEMAKTVARVPSDLQQVNKRSVHRSFEVLGGRTAIRAAQELQALAAYQESVKEARKNPFESIKKAFD
ncbi:MAG: enoyl-CoA hydratase [Acidimicrobiaceae bacterium]|nr:enoyl-CoA hydratase [Acidimicrobiaceae bacterium]MBJ87874.1 enoyl-CoA hydratase [Acidimicrobiaceae bacterium]|tara:strand:+ start:343 stop:1134 length:792 start_codon:yes stop_codon:yes gene_type:complete